HLVHRLQEVALLDDGAAFPPGQNGRLVDQAGQVGSREAEGLLGDLVQVHVVAYGLVPAVKIQDVAPPFPVGQVDPDNAVEAAGAQQGFVQQVRPVGGRHHYDGDVVIPAEAVHLHQQLVQGL